MAGAEDPLAAQMIAYYAARADEYDDWYLRRGRYSHGAASDMAWRSELTAAATWLEGLQLRGEIVELAAGTGWWSPILARRGRLALYDASPEPLAHARRRLEVLGLSATFDVRDAWAEPDRRADGVFTGFWLSHVGRDRLVEFLRIVSRWLDPSGRFAFIDSRLDPDSSALDHRAPVDDLQTRRLEDGRAYQVRKVHYSATEYRRALSDAGFSGIEVVETERFFVLGTARMLPGSRGAA